MSKATSRTDLYNDPLLILERLSSHPGPGSSSFVNLPSSSSSRAIPLQTHVSTISTRESYPDRHRSGGEDIVGSHSRSASYHSSSRRHHSESRPSPSRSFNTSSSTSLPPSILRSKQPSTHSFPRDPIDSLRPLSIASRDRSTRIHTTDAIDAHMSSEAVRLIIRALEKEVDHLAAEWEKAEAELVVKLRRRTEGRCNGQSGWRVIHDSDDEWTKINRGVQVDAGVRLLDNPPQFEAEVTSLSEELAGLTRMKMWMIERYEERFDFLRARLEGAIIRESLRR